MFCPNCGKDVGSTGKFCLFCGASIYGPGADDRESAASVPQYHGNGGELTFSMTITDVFSISGKGLVLKGTVQTGSVSTDCRVKIDGQGGSEYQIKGIERDHTLVQSAAEGDTIGILIGAVGIDKADLTGKTVYIEEIVAETEEAEIDFSGIAGLAGQISSSGERAEEERVWDGIPDWAEDSIPGETAGFASGSDDSGTSDGADVRCDDETGGDDAKEEEGQVSEEYVQALGEISELIGLRTGSG